MAHRVVRHNIAKNELETVDLPSLAFFNGQSQVPPDGRVSNHPILVCGLCVFSPLDGHDAGVYPLTLCHLSSGVHVDNIMVAHASLEPVFFSFHPASSFNSLHFC